jgi:hypothetical protein
VGASVRWFVGRDVGTFVGALVGVSDGSFVGGFVGVFVGCLVGSFVGVFVGCGGGGFVGIFVGCLFGGFVGLFVGGRYPQVALSVHPSSIGAFGAEHPQRDGSLLALSGLAQNSSLPFALQTKNISGVATLKGAGHPMGAGTFVGGLLGAIPCGSE